MSSPLLPTIMDQLEAGVVEAGAEVEEAMTEAVAGDAAVEPRDQSHHQQEQSQRQKAEKRQRGIPIQQEEMV